MFKKISIIFIMLICLVIPVTAIDSPAYTIENTTLYINEDLDNYTLENLPEYISDQITTVIVREGVSSISDFAFFQMTALEEVYLPDTVKSIGQYAFYKDAALTTINIENIETIDKYAFYGCSNLDFTTDAECGACALEFEGDAQNAYKKSLAKVEAMIDYLNEVYLVKYPALGFDIDYCSADDIELLQALANKITAGCSTDSAKARAIYDWVRNNIAYGTSTNSFSAIDVYKNREGICSGYAHLEKALFSLSGIPSAIVRCSLQGPPNIDLEISNYYLDKNGHEFTIAYVDNDWYGYDACWGRHNNIEVVESFCKMSAERMAERSVVLEIDGILAYSDEAWDYTCSTFKYGNVWYVDGEFLCMQKGNIAHYGSHVFFVGGCLNWNTAVWYDSRIYYYSYLGTETNVEWHALKGGYYIDKLFPGQDLLYYQENGVQESEYFSYNNEIYFKGIKVNNLIPDLGLTDNNINMYIGESFDLAALYSGYTISSDNTNLSVNGTVITSVSAGKSTITISNGTKKYSLTFCIRDYTADSLTQELCDHDHTHVCGTNEVCSYCGKVIKTIPIISTLQTHTIIASTTTTKKITLSSTATSALKSTSKKSIFKIKK